jgi:putative OmpL-like beta-barrel porin-2
MNNYYFIFAFVLMNSFLSAQDSTVSNKGIALSIFADIYYSYDFNKPPSHQKPSFLYNHNRHNEVNINLALAKVSFNKERIRANIGLMAGTYVQYNLSAEPELLRHLYEANAGIKISCNRDLWIDAGILPSHIGFETVISKDNWTLTRSIAAENSPYYESGIKITYSTSNKKILISGLVLNGWQRIRRPDYNNTPAFGTQLIISPPGNITFNWSSFIGNDKPDSARQMRWFNNFYSIINLDEKFGITAGFDIGWQEKLNSNKKDAWYSPILIVRFLPDKKWEIALSGEYYSDHNGVIITTGTPNGFKTFGASFNIGKKLFDHLWWRTEFRLLKSKDAIFLKENSLQNNHAAITTSMAISF